jgi:hypothetical protein
MAAHDDKAVPGQQYSFIVRFGTPAISEGVVPIPRIVLDNYSALGIDDRTMMWVVHLLAYKWSADSPFPKRASLHCTAGEASQKRYARRLREKGVLFTSRRFQKGRVVSLVYDLDSLLHNCVRLHQATNARIDEYLAENMSTLDPLDRYLRAHVRTIIQADVLAIFKVELPPEVETRLKAGEYDDVPPPWDKLTPAPKEGEALLDEYFGPRQEPIPLITQGDSKGKNWADPAQAGGASSSAEIVVDGICRFNTIPGIESLPPKERTALVRHVHEIIEKWGSATPEQAKLAWEAWTIRYGWRNQCNAFYTNFATEYGMLLIAVKEGTITLESLQEEDQQQELKARKDDPQAPQNRQHYQNWATAPGKVIPAPPTVPDWWKRILDDLRLQITEASYSTWLANTSATRTDGVITILAKNGYGKDWLSHRLHAIILRTARRVLDEDTLEIEFAVKEQQEETA